MKSCLVNFGKLDACIRPFLQPRSHIIYTVHINEEFLAAIYIYRICGIIGESNIWQFALKMQLVRFLIGYFKYCMKRNPCLQPKWCTFDLAIFM